jgi:hypothetical protein
MRETPEIRDGLASDLLRPILRLHEALRAAVVAACEEHEPADMAAVAHEADEDTIYAIDRVGEETLVDFVEAEIARRVPVILIAEGLAGGEVVLPRGANPDDAVWRIIVDPIDGTRGLMYQKRSAWILTGVAPNRGASTDLQDIELAVQTEIPLVKQHLSDTVWAVRGRGASASRYNRWTRTSAPLLLQPSRARSIRHGFSTVCRFFPGARDVLAAIDDEIAIGAMGPIEAGRAHCFEDQYISTGGQLYELMAGHDRFVADLRPLIDDALKRNGQTLGLCTHPYDLCTELIARELGIIITDERGEPVRAPLTLSDNVTWIGYANEHIRAQVEPLLQKALQRRDLLE